MASAPQTPPPPQAPPREMSLELILTFHGLGEAPSRVPACERKYWVPLEWFEAIIDAAPADKVAITFDDGNVSDIERALPALRQRGIAARFFPVAGRIGVEGYLSAADIEELSAAGMSIGSHGLRHRDWCTLAEDELHEELAVSRRTLSEILDTEITEAACPFGSYNRRVLRALHAVGYRRVFNSDGDPGHPGSWPSSRTTVDRERPLEHWLNLASTSTIARVGAWASPVLLSKRLVRRLR